MPVLLVEGAKTGSVVRDIDDLLLGCLRSAQRDVIPDSGHAMQYDAPDRVARVVTDFLKS